MNGENWWPNAAGIEPNYTVIALPDRDESLLKQGENTIAVHCNQTVGRPIHRRGAAEFGARE